MNHHDRLPREEAKTTGVVLTAFEAYVTARRTGVSRSIAEADLTRALGALASTGVASRAACPVCDDTGLVPLARAVTPGRTILRGSRCVCVAGWRWVEKRSRKQETPWTLTSVVEVATHVELESLFGTPIPGQAPRPGGRVLAVYHT